MANRFFQQFGPWKPFPEPLPPPIVDPRDEPWLIVKFNEAWLPYIVGCLSSLARPETYEDVLDNFIREDIDNGGELPWLIEPFPVVQFYNWYWAHDASQTNNLPHLTTYEFYAPGIDGNYGAIFQAVDFDVNNAVQLDIQGYEIGSNSPVGGPISSFAAQLWQTVVGNVFHVTTIDCLDNEVATDYGGQSFEVIGGSYKHISVLTQGAFQLVIQTNGDWTCGVA